MKLFSQHTGAADSHLNISSIVAIITHVNRTAAVGATTFVPVTALAVRRSGAGYAVASAPDESVRSDVSQRLLPATGASRLPLSVPIRAFRAQLAVSGPEFTDRKWTLLCGFEGASAVDASSTQRGGSRRAIPPFIVPLPTATTAATPMMTPAASADTAFLEGASGEGAAADCEANGATTLADLLRPLVTEADLTSLAWAVRLIFVIGEDVEEERVRRDAMRAEAVVVAKATDKRAASHPTDSDKESFGAALEMELQQRISRAALEVQRFSRNHSGGNQKHATKNIVDATFVNATHRNVMPAAAADGLKALTRARFLEFAASLHTDGAQQ